MSQRAVAGAATPIAAKAGLRLWTDDYNSVLPLLKWERPQEPAEPGDSKEPEEPQKAEREKEPATRP